MMAHALHRLWEDDAQPNVAQEGGGSTFLTRLHKESEAVEEGAQAGVGIAGAHASEPDERPGWFVEGESKKSGAGLLFFAYGGAQMQHFLREAVSRLCASPILACVTFLPAVVMHVGCASTHVGFLFLFTWVVPCRMPMYTRGALLTPM